MTAIINPGNHAASCLKGARALGMRLEGMHLLNSYEAEKGNFFLMGRLCFYPMELINGSYRWFSMFEINHLKLIFRDYRSKAISLTLGDV